MAKRAAYRRRKQNRFGMFLACTVVVMLLVVVAVESVELTAKLEVYQQREQELEAQILAEEDRAKEIEEYEKYTHTMKYKEEIARDRLGLVYEGEILFRDEN